MKSQNSLGLHFMLRAASGASQGLVYLRLTVNTQRTEHSLKLKVSRSDWDVGKGRFKGNSEEAKKLNRYLQQVYTRYMDCYRRLETEHRLITAESLKSVFLGEEPRQQTIMSLCAYHQEYCRTTLAHGTLKNYLTTEKYLKEYLHNKFRLSDLALAEINYAFIADFELFLRRHQPVDHHKRLSTNGVMKHLERLRKLISLAYRMEWMTHEPFRNYKLKFTKVDVGFLTASELASIEAHRFRSERLTWVRDLFVFCCYTGLAFADVMALSPSNIVADHQGQQWIHIKRTKTGVQAKIPLLKIPSLLIDIYSNDPRSIYRNSIFPKISNQKYNCYLKEIAELCDISKTLTSHQARHTFGTTVTLANGISLSSVSKMLGHTKLATTQIYARAIEATVGKEMNELDKKLYGALK